MYYSIICRRLSHGRKLSLAGEQANLCRERQREERGFRVGFRSVRKSMPKVLAKLETWLWARQPNQQAIVAGRTRCYLKSKPRSPLPVSLSCTLKLFTVAIKISAQRRRLKLFNFIKTKRRRALELQQRAEVTPWQRQQTEIR